MTIKTPTPLMHKNAEITDAELRAHMARVETLCDIVETLVKGMANHPLFGGMIPPDIRAKFAE